jgi:hypothetical protein
MMILFGASYTNAVRTPPSGQQYVLVLDHSDPHFELSPIPPHETNTWLDDLKSSLQPHEPLIPQANQPGDALLARYIPDETPERREYARFMLRSYALMLYKLGDELLGTSPMPTDEEWMAAAE